MLCCVTKAGEEEILTSGPAEIRETRLGCDAACSVSSALRFSISVPLCVWCFSSQHSSNHDVKKPAARPGFGVFGEFTLQTPKTRPPTPLGHRVFGCTKNHDLGLHLRVSVPQQCLRGLLWPYEARHRLKLLHRRQASPTGDPRMLSAQTSAPRSGSGTSSERTCANARPSPSSSGFQAFWAQREGL